MNRYIIFIALMAGLLLATFPKAACGDVLANEQDSDVSITITKFQLNDQNLELSWKIVNSSDHDVWICESMSRDYPPPLFEQFLDEDAKTLVIRKLFDLPMREELTLAYPPIGSCYVRLHPGEEKVESVSVALPVSPYRMSASNKATNAEYAERLALEIGYYDEDLPALILEIVEISEHLNIDFSVGYHGFRKDVRDRFFGGPIVALLFKGMLGFESNVRSADADGEMWMPHFYKVRMGEKILRIEIDGVSIPYKSNYPPLTDEQPQSETEPDGVTMALTGLDVNEPIISPRVNNQRLELSWKIRNDTDHDVWVLVSLNPELTYVYDIFMDSDAKTLVLRRRFNLPEGQGWEHLPRARYVRLRSDQEITESVSLTIPVKPRTVFDRLLGNAEFAKRLTLEIGFYNEDLLGLILDIAEMAEELSCDIGLDSPVFDPYDMDVRRRFFGGVFVARFFYLESFEYFRNSVTSGGDEVFIPYMWQTLDGEKVLRIEVDNVSIPYESKYPPLND